MTILNQAKREARIKTLANRLQGEPAVREYLDLLREEVICVQMERPELEHRTAPQITLLTSILRAVTPPE